MIVYTIEPLLPEFRVIYISFDAGKAEGLQGKLEKVDGVTAVFPEDRLGDIYFTICISRRADVEDVQVLLLALDDVCNEQAETSGGTVAE